MKLASVPASFQNQVVAIDLEVDVDDRGSFGPVYREGVVEDLLPDSLTEVKDTSVTLRLCLQPFIETDPDGHSTLLVEVSLNYIQSLFSELCRELTRLLKLPTNLPSCHNVTFQTLSNLRRFKTRLKKTASEVSIYLGTPTRGSIDLNPVRLVIPEDLLICALA